MKLTARSSRRPDSDPDGFTASERTILGGLTALLVLRMLGFNLVLPVLTPYAKSLHGSTPILVGLSIGVYGLAQTLLQVPFGWWSDRWGRKPILTVALVLFTVGSAICALAASAWALVLGRLIQGMGANASVLVATIADMTRERVRTRAMAAVGVSIGASFAVGLLCGPAAAHAFGIPALFWLTAGLSALGIAYLWWRIPAPPRLGHHDDLEYSSEHLFEVLRNTRLLRLDFGVFNVHMCLSAIFVTVPFVLRQLLDPVHQWRFFLPLMVGGLAIMLGAAHLGERPGRTKKLAIAGQALLVLALVALALTVPTSALVPGSDLGRIFFGLFLFIAAFAILEPLFPALLTRICSQTNRGTAAGLYNMSQFSGAFLGAFAAGVLLEKNMEALFWILTGSSVLALVGAFGLHDPARLSTIELVVAPRSPEERRVLVRRLLALEGVEDVAWKREEMRLSVRYAESRIDRARLEAEAGGPG